MDNKGFDLLNLLKVLQFEIRFLIDFQEHSPNK